MIRLSIQIAVIAIIIGFSNLCCGQFYQLADGNSISQITTKDSNGNPNNDNHIGGKKSPALAFILSFFVFPGVGQIYNGETGKGLTQMALGGTGIIMMIAGYGNNDHLLVRDGLFLDIGVSLWSCIDAPLSAKKINAKRGYSKRNTAIQLIRSLSFSPGYTGEGTFQPSIAMTLRF